jgi:small subunit ribosomal protein S3
VVIERTLKRITLTIHTARPGVVIGKGGTEVDKIKEELKKITGKDVQINIFEIKRPELDSKLVGESIAQQIEARISYKRAMKQAIASAMRVGSEGIKVKVSGRLAGSDMARTEQYKEGRIPLHTLRADIDYAISEAQTVYGKIGIKVWIFKGEIYGKRDLSPNIGLVSNAPQGQGGQGGSKGGGGNERGGAGRRDNRGGGSGGPRRGGDSGGGARRGGSGDRGGNAGGRRNG